MTKPTGIVSIHGREYETVALRVKRFREAHPDWSIITEILHRDDDVVIMRASIADPTGRTIATGHAEEWRNSSTINKTSATENAETSSIGRALAALGYGGTEFATANEIEIAKGKEKAESPYAGHTAGQANYDAFNALPEDSQKVLRDAAIEIIGHVEAGEIAEALAIKEKVCGDDQEGTMALWSLLPSNVRSAIKKATRKDA